MGGMTTTPPLPTRWTVETESGTVYHLDLAHKVLRRAGGTEASELRRDGAEIRIIAMTEPVVGKCWRLVLDLGLDTGALTTRVTTAVVGIEAAEDERPQEG